MRFDPIFSPCRTSAGPDIRWEDARRQFRRPLRIQGERHYLEGSDGKTRVFKGPNVVNVIDTPKPEKAEKVTPDTRTTHTVTTEEGVMQFNPETSRYDIRVGARPTREFAPPRESSDPGLPKKEMARVKESIGQNNPCPISQIKLSQFAQLTAQFSYFPSD